MGVYFQLHIECELRSAPRSDRHVIAQTKSPVARCSTFLLNLLSAHVAPVKITMIDLLSVEDCISLVSVLSFTC